MASEDTATVLGGAAQGAAAGAAFGVPGAVIGGVIGAIGGLFGAKANKSRRKARKEQRRMTEREQAVQRRDIIRQFRFARAQALAAGSSEDGGLQSSGVQGALGSVTSQGVFNLGFFDAQVASQNRINDLLKTAGKYEGYLSIFQSLAEGTAAVAELIPGKLATQAVEEIQVTARRKPTGLYNKPSTFQTFPIMD